MKTNYVCGIVVSPDEQIVVLLNKERPEWQKGRYNFPGGRVKTVEREQPAAACSRLVSKETGMDIRPEEWVHVAVQSGDFFTVDYFFVRSAEAQFARTQFVNFREDVSLFHPTKLSSIRLVPNVRMLMSIAMDASTIAKPVYLRDTTTRVNIDSTRLSKINSLDVPNIGGISVAEPNMGLAVTGYPHLMMNAVEPLAVAEQPVADENMF